MIGLGMGIWPALWLPLRPVHLTLNLLGWLTPLIYGVTYRMIPIFVRRELYSLRLVYAQWGLAALALAVLVLAQLLALRWLGSLGWVIQVAAALLFLGNIIAAARRGRPVGETETVLGSPLPDDARMDRTARRFTETAIVFFIAASIWSAGAHLSGGRQPPGADLLLRYGWLALTVFGTSYHLLPRLAGLAVSVRWMRHQLLLGAAGTLALAAGLSNAGLVALGLAGLIHCAQTLPLAHRCRRGSGVRLQGAALVLVRTATLSLGAGSLAALGTAAGLGSGWWLAHTHLLFLGWMTLLAYGVAGNLLPLLAGRTLALSGLYRLQAAAAIVGLVLQAGAFFVWSTPALRLPLFATGATLSALAPLLFLANLLAAGFGKEAPPPCADG